MFNLSHHTLKMRKNICVSFFAKRSLSLSKSYRSKSICSLTRYGFLVFLALFCQEIFATPINVAINTSAFSGQSGTLVFDLIDSSSASSSLTVSNFTGDFIPGSPSLTGDSSGSVGTGFSQ
jgi:hypothetical protein